MKDFFEDLGKRLSETAEAVTAKAGDAIEIQKLKAQIRELARGNAEDLMELGHSALQADKESWHESYARLSLFRHLGRPWQAVHSKSVDEMLTSTTL